MFYNDEEGLDGLRGKNRAQTTPDASFGPIGTCFFNINVFFIFLFIFFYYYDTQRPPHPPRSQTRAEGGFSITHHQPRRPTKAHSSQPRPT
jgi:hypothetical protein